MRVWYMHLCVHMYSTCVYIYAYTIHACTCTHVWYMRVHVRVYGTCVYIYICNNDIFFSAFLMQEFLIGMDKHLFANAKLQKDASSAALKLMDCVFTTAELVNSNLSGQTNSKDSVRERTVHALNPAKMQFISGVFNKTAH